MPPSPAASAASCISRPRSAIRRTPSAAGRALGRDQGGDLPQRVAPHRKQVEIVGDRPPAGHRGAEDRRLGVAGPLVGALERGRSRRPRRRASRRSGQKTSTVRFMSAVWLPWPGKRIASVGWGCHRWDIAPPQAGVGDRRAPDPPEWGGQRRSGGAGGRARGQVEALGLLGRLGPVADAELAVDRAGVLLDRVRREVQVVGDLFVRRAGRDQREDLLLALGERRVERRRGRRRPRCPSETIRTALTTSTADQSLEMKPEAPAERATKGEIDAGAGDQQHPGARADARGSPRRPRRPDSLAEQHVDQGDLGLQAAADRRPPRRRRRRRGSARPSSGARAAGGSPTGRRRGRRRRGPAGCPPRLAIRHPTGTTRRTRQRPPGGRRTRPGPRSAALPAPPAAGPRPPPLVLWPSPAPSFSTARREGLAVGGDADLDPARLGVAVGVAQRLGEDRLGERLEVRPAPRPPSSHWTAARAGARRSRVQHPRPRLGRCRAGRRRPAGSSACAQVADDRAQLLLAAAPLRLGAGRARSRAPGRRRRGAGSRSRAARGSARPVRSSRRSLSRCSVECSTLAVSAASRPRVSIVSRSPSSSDELLAVAVGEDHPEPAPGGGDRRAGHRRESRPARRSAPARGRRVRRRPRPPGPLRAPAGRSASRRGSPRSAS